MGSACRHVLVRVATGWVVGMARLDSARRFGQVGQGGVSRAGRGGAVPGRVG